MKSNETEFLCSAIVDDAASGSGVAQPGNVQFTFTRVGAGIYHYRFSGVNLISAVAGSAQSGDTQAIAALDATDPGFMQVVTVISAAYANIRHSWAATVRRRV